MKKWINKLIEQLDFDLPKHHHNETPSDMTLNDERATLLYLIDVYNKHLFEVEHHSIRRTRNSLDEFSKELLNPENKNLEKVLFRFRQFFNSYRLDEYTYIQKTFDEFRNIIWDFVDQIGEDFASEDNEDQEIELSLNNLKEAVEANSIEDLKNQSRLFIDNYIEYQTRKEERKTLKLTKVKRNLEVVKKKLVEAKTSMMTDHLTSAYNRKSFDEHIEQQHKLFKATKVPVSLIIMDIDHFKKFNDTYGHAIGDFILKECVKILKNCFSREQDFVARIGGEEFSVILPEHKIDHAIQKAEKALAVIRSEIFTHEGHELKFRMSMGIAELAENESGEHWIKRADAALYEAKNSGRDRYIVASAPNTLVAA